MTKYILMESTMQDQYKDYIKQHVANVKLGYEWLRKNLPDLLEKCSSQMDSIIKNHDKSKYDLDEFEPYAKYFYDNKKTKEVEDNFNYAWLQHIHKNPHHWQHWILVHDDEPTEILDMPYDYIIEMICDWWSFSWKTNNLNEIFNWYETHKNMQLSDKTRATIEKILNKIKIKLAE